MRSFVVAAIVAACLCASARADYFEVWSVDPTTAKNLEFIVSDTKALPTGGVGITTKIGGFNVTAFNAGGTGSKCDGDQLDVSVFVQANAGISPVKPRIRMQSRDANGFHTIKMGVAGVNMELDFDLQQLAGPSAPAEFDAGQSYKFELNFKDAIVEAPVVGKTKICVNLNTREIVAKVSIIKWLYFNIPKDLGGVFYMNVATDSGDVIASIKVCTDQAMCAAPPA